MRKWTPIVTGSIAVVAMGVGLWGRAHWGEVEYRYDLAELAWMSRSMYTVATGTSLTAGTGDARDPVTDAACHEDKVCSEMEAKRRKNAYTLYGLGGGGLLGLVAGVQVLLVVREARMRERMRRV